VVTKYEKDLLPAMSHSLAFVAARRGSSLVKEVDRRTNTPRER